MKWVPVLSVFLGLFLGLMLTGLLGENPLFVGEILVRSIVGSKENLAASIFYATPLLLTGLSVTLAFRAGLFNIGAEGQLLMGAMGTTTVGLLLGDRISPASASPLLGLLGAVLAGGLWGGIAGVLRAKRGAHEVITTIMLNFIAAGVTSYLVLNVFASRVSQAPETSALPSQYQLPGYGEMGWGLLFPIGMMVLLVLGLHWIFQYTKFGFELRAVGSNEVAARQAGIPVERVRIWAMVGAGMLAGLVGVHEILGASGKFRIGFSADFGFMGIAVALLGRGKPFGVLLSALLMGALHKGSADLDLETEHVTRDLSMILQALMILSVSATGFWQKILGDR
jgi:simple sugar transport system permease protein